MSGYASSTFRRVVIWKLRPASRFVYEILGISFFAQKRSTDSPVFFLNSCILVPIANKMCWCCSDIGDFLSYFISMLINNDSETDQSSIIFIICHNYYHTIIKKCHKYYHIIMTLFLYLSNEKENQVFPGTLLCWLWNSWSVFTSYWSGRWKTSRCICRKSAWTIFTVHLISLCCKLI